MRTYHKEQFEEIVKKLKNNEIFIIKTDTVYGIMALGNKDNEIKINQLKNSNINKKISLIFANTDELIKNADVNEEQVKLINKYLPGKNTLILNLKKEFSTFFNRTDFGVRVTEYKFLQDVIYETGPLLATSCNITGLNPCLNYEEITKMFNDKDVNVVFDDAATTIPSTIIDIRDEIQILRG